MEHKNKIQQILDIRGGVWLSLFTSVMLLALIRSVVTRTEIPTSALTLYGTVLGTFAMTKTAVKMMNGKNGHKVEE